MKPWVELIQQSTPIGFCGPLAYPCSAQYAADGEDWTLDKALRLHLSLQSMLMKPPPGIKAYAVIRLAKEMRRNRLRIQALQSGDWPEHRPKWIPKNWPEHQRIPRDQQFRIKQPTRNPLQMSPDNWWIAV